MANILLGILVVLGWITRIHGTGVQIVLNDDGTGKKMYPNECKYLTLDF